MKRDGGSGSRPRGLSERSLRGLPPARTGARQRCVSQLTHGLSAALGREREVVCYSEPPAARNSNLSVRLLPLHAATWPPQRKMARRLRTRSIARSLARTIVTCTKSAPPRTLPPAVGAQKQGGALAPTMFLEQPDQSADSRDVRKSRRACPTMIFNGERRQPRTVVRALARIAGWRHFGRAAKQSRRRPDGGGQSARNFKPFVGREPPFTPTIAPRKPLQSGHRGDCRGTLVHSEPYRTCSSSERYRTCPDIERGPA
jgi:hypothetical protein